MGGAQATPDSPDPMEAAEQALFTGDWNLASASYQAALDQSTDADTSAIAQLGLGKARLSSGDVTGAIAEFTALLKQYPDSPQAADAHFLLGEAYRATGQWDQAAEAYRAYQQLRPGTIDSYVEERIAGAYAYTDHAAAAQAYAAAIAAPRAGDVSGLREALASIYEGTGDVEGALAQYEAVYQGTDQNLRKARMDVLAGQLLYRAGRLEAAYQKFLDAVNNFPEAGDTFQGLLTLVNDGVPVDDLQRGLTNYYAENYEPALAAFDRYLAAQPDATQRATALYFKGLTLAALGQAAQSIAVFRTIVEDYPNDAYWSKAYFQIAFVQPYPDDVQTFQDFAAAAPQSPDAPDALYRAARLCERNDDLRRAAELWTRIALEYPGSAQAADAAMQAGIVLYRAGDFGAAGQRFELALGVLGRSLNEDERRPPSTKDEGVAARSAGDPEQRARAWLWIGKVKEKLGDQASAQAAWGQAASLGPHGYYPLRAGQLLRGEAPFTPPEGYDLSFDAALEKVQVEQWMRVTFPAAQPVDALSQLPPGIWQEARFVRGAELWRLGLLREAHDEFDSLRRALAGDPVAMWQLALYFNEIGAYDLSIRSARQIVDLAGYSDTLLAPRFILRLRYPAPFAGLVTSAAAEYELHPFVMYAKMRLESFFWKFALSSAEARGLNQIIPPTADDIARRIGLADFDYEDLYRPAVSIPMGAFYLAHVGTVTGADVEGALAGYYAGPGNAGIWQDLANGDPDLFVEVIRLPDAKRYVQTAYEYFEEYRELYGN